MNRTTITLTDDDASKLERLKKRHQASSSKIIRTALRKFYEQAYSQSLEEAYKNYYSEEDRERSETLDDFSAAGIELW